MSINCHDDYNHPQYQEVCQKNKEPFVNFVTGIFIGSALQASCSTYVYYKRGLYGKAMTWAMTTGTLTIGAICSVAYSNSSYAPNCPMEVENEL